MEARLHWNQQTESQCRLFPVTLFTWLFARNEAAYVKRFMFKTVQTLVALLQEAALIHKFTKH